MALLKPEVRADAMRTIWKSMIGRGRTNVRRSMAVFFLCATNLAGADVPAEAEKTMQKFYTVFSGANAEAMTPFLADEILFVGEAEIGGKVAWERPVKLSRKNLLAGYTKVFARWGQQDWAKLTKKAKPSAKISRKDQKLVDFGLAKEGDIIFDVHFREAKKGERNDYDEAIVFIVRKVEGEYIVVANVGDPGGPFPAPDR